MSEKSIEDQINKLAQEKGFVLDDPEACAMAVKSLSDKYQPENVVASDADMLFEEIDKVNEACAVKPGSTPEIDKSRQALTR